MRYAMRRALELARAIMKRAAQRPLLLATAIVFAVSAAARLPDLDATCNVDAILYWFGRTRRFWQAVSEGRFADTYFSPHPGVSIMWLSGLGMNLTGTLGGAVTERSVVAATAPLAFVTSLVPAATVPLVYLALAAGAPLVRGLASAWMADLSSTRTALAVSATTGLLLATEPFFVAHGRTYHLDAMAASFIWLGCLFGLVALVERRWRWAVGAGLGFGIAILTRTLSGTFAACLALAYGVLLALERPRSARLPLLLAVMGVVALAVVILSWPALAVEPFETVRRIVRDTTNTIDDGHVVLSWGKIHRRDPGPAFYLAVLLMRLSPEVLGCALLGTFSCFLWPKRWLFVLAVLACAYLPPAIGLTLSAKKGDRYVLLYFPLLTFVGTAGAAVIGRRLVAHARASAWALVAPLGIAALVFGVRVARVVRIHPLPITYCASYPGLACESLITIGQGEGFRDAALWIARHSPVKNPYVLSAYARGAVMSPWLDFRRARDARDAHFVLTYIASDQRRLDRGVRKHAVGEPLHEVRYENRTYIGIYPGPKYPKAARRTRHGSR